MKIAQLFIAFLLSVSSTGFANSNTDYINTRIENLKTLNQQLKDLEVQLDAANKEATLSATSSAVVTLFSLPLARQLARTAADLGARAVIVNNLNSGEKFKFAASSIATVVILIGTGRQYANLITDIRTIVQLKAKIKKKQTDIAQEVQILSSIQDELK